jgi:DNA modification methylase
MVNIESGTVRVFTTQKKKPTRHGKRFWHRVNMKAMEIKKVKISQVKANPENPRLIKDDKFFKLVRSIQDFPQMLDIRPIVVNDDMIVLGGNMRLKACKEAGLKEVSIIMASDLTEDQQREFIIKDNVGFGEWDWEDLANNWNVDELSEWGLDIPDLKPLEVEAVEDDFDVPDEIKTDIVIGDLFEIGPHRLLCGSSTNSDDVSKLMGTIYPDLIHTDPPYGMSAVSKSGVLKKKYGQDIIGDENPEIAKDAFRLIYNLFPESKQIWWGANYYSSVLPDSECWLVWDKNNGQSDQTDCELAWANFRSVVRQFTQASEKTNRVHPTQKPVSLVSWIMKRFNLTSKTIADFFGGSGVTMVAAHQMNKVSFLMEYDPRFCQVIVDRMINLDPSLEVKRNGQPYVKTKE